MTDMNPLLKIRFDGDAVGPGRIPVAHLLRFLACMNKALQRTGRILTGEAASVRRGMLTRSIKEEVALDLVFDAWQSCSCPGLQSAADATGIAGHGLGP